MTFLSHNISLKVKYFISKIVKLIVILSESIYMFRVCRSLRVGAQAKMAGVERLLLVCPSVSTAKQVKLPNTSPWEFAMGYNLLSTLDTCFGSSKDCTHILQQKESPKNSELFTSECSRW